MPHTKLRQDTRTLAPQSIRELFVFVGADLDEEGDEGKNIFKMKPSWYSALCNRWSSLFGVSFIAFLCKDH